MITRLDARRALVACLGASAIAIAAPRAAGAQPARGMPPALRDVAPVRSLEGFLTRYQLDSDAAGRLTVDGVGSRLVWTSARALENPASLAARTGVGVFGIFLPEQNRLGFSMLHAGTELTVRPLAAPVLDRIEPVVSLGVGALRTHAAELSRSRLRTASVADRSNVSLALSPGLGARVALAPGLDLRGDVRDVVTTRDALRNNVAWGLGLGMTF